MPIMPVGARVWLTKNRAGEQMEEKLSHGTLPWALSVRTSQGGRLLFGALHNTTDAVGVPVTIGAIQPICSTPYPQACHQDGVIPTMTYRSVEIVGDATVTVASGHTAQVAIDGVAYDVVAEAEAVTDALDGCGDVWGLELLRVTVQAHDMAALVAGLDVGEPPACGNGNAPLQYVSLLMRDDVQAIDTNYDGRAVSHGPDPDHPSYVEFDLPDFTGAHGRPILLAGGMEALVGRPAKGTTYWASVGTGRPIRLLRESQAGPLVVASTWATEVPLPAAMTADLESLLGVTVDVVQRCTYAIDYAGNPVPLWDLVLGTTPPTRIPAGGSGTLAIGGKPYTVQTQGMGTLGIVVYPAR
jgi:hypothetical protein